MLNLDQHAIDQANQASQFEAGNYIAQDAKTVYTYGLDIISEAAKRPNLTADQITYLDERRGEWKELCEKSFNDVLRRRASWVPITVAGASNYNASRNQMRAKAGAKVEMEWAAKRQRFLDNTLFKLDKFKPVTDVVEEYRTGKRSDPISADDPAAEEKLAARIEYLKGEHERGKAKNAWYRKHGTMRGFGGLSDEEATMIDNAIQAPSHMYHVPYPPYEGQAANANIKRLEKRLNAVQVRA